MILTFCNKISYEREDHLELQFKSIMDEQVQCMVENAFHEARGEGTLGRQLVMQVVLNRASSMFDLCNQVYRHKQFSWTLSKKKAMPEKMMDALKIEFKQLCKDPTVIPEQFRRATHYHTHAVKPVWRKRLKRLGAFKNHIFYRKHHENFIYRNGAVILNDIEHRTKCT